MRPVICVFAKAPTEGAVKTRLSPALPPAAAAALYKAFVFDILESFKQFTHCDLELHTGTPTDAWSRAGVPTRLQAAGGLQLKLLHAMRSALDEGRPRVLIVGSDAPTLPADCPQQLLDSRADVALGPAEDGGFWGICSSRVRLDMFDGVRWSCEFTLEDTYRSCRAAGLSVEIGPLWWDVDRPEDIARLMADPSLGRAVRSCIASPEWHASFAGIVQESHQVRHGSR